MPDTGWFGFVRTGVRGLGDLFAGLHQAERRGARRRGGEDAVDVVERQEVLERCSAAGWTCARTPTYRRGTPGGRRCTSSGSPRDSVGGRAGRYGGHAVAELSPSVPSVASPLAPSAYSHRSVPHRTHPRHPCRRRCPRPCRRRRRAVGVVFSLDLRRAVTRQDRPDVVVRHFPLRLVVHRRVLSLGAQTVALRRWNQCLRFDSAARRILLVGAAT